MRRRSQSSSPEKHPFPHKRQRLEEPPQLAGPTQEAEGPRSTPRSQHELSSGGQPHDDPGPHPHAEVATRARKDAPSGGNLVGRTQSGTSRGTDHPQESKPLGTQDPSPEGSPRRSFLQRTPRAAAPPQATARDSPDRTPSPRPTRRQWSDLLLEEYRSARPLPTRDAEAVPLPVRETPVPQTEAKPQRVEKGSSTGGPVGLQPPITAAQVAQERQFLRWGLRAALQEALERDKVQTELEEALRRAAEEVAETRRRAVAEVHQAREESRTLLQEVQAQLNELRETTGQVRKQRASSVASDTSRRSTSRVRVVTPAEEELLALRRAAFEGHARARMQTAQEPKAPPQRRMGPPAASGIPPQRTRHWGRPLAAASTGAKTRTPTQKAPATGKHDQLWLPHRGRPRSRPRTQAPPTPRKGPTQAARPPTQVPPKVPTGAPRSGAPLPLPDKNAGRDPRPTGPEGIPAQDRPTATVSLHAAVETPMQRAQQVTGTPTHRAPRVPLPRSATREPPPPSPQTAEAAVRRPQPPRGRPFWAHHTWPKIHVSLPRP